MKWCHTVIVLAGAVLILAAGCATQPAGIGQGPLPDKAVTDTMPAAGTQNLTYPVVDTGQTSCYDNSQQILCPGAGQGFYGQDAQFSGRQPSYRISSDGLTVYDTVTSLTWQRSPDTNSDGTLSGSDKLTYSQALALPATLNAKNFGGYSDWRLPGIKELYSLIDFQGTDPNPTGSDTSGLTPFIDTRHFTFAYGRSADGDRIIDSQYASSTLYTGRSTGESKKLFGVNFADGRIKGYNLKMPNGAEKTFFVVCVRGNPEYGRNRFTDNGDGTITDSATGLIWSEADSGTGLDWQEALAWVQEKNGENYLGHNDWRLPDAKELQSIVDYSRSPDSTGTAAIDPVFNSTKILNEAGQADYPFYWTGTTHASAGGQGHSGDYLAFGRALGYMNGAWQDVHGAGAQRSDPKTGDAKDFPQGRGPQGDAIRIDNFVRLVRGGNVTAAKNVAALRTTLPSGPASVPRVPATESPGPGAQHDGGAAPPQEAIAACFGKTRGTTCSFTSPRGMIPGSCQVAGSPELMACVPSSNTMAGRINS